MENEDYNKLLARANEIVYFDETNYLRETTSNIDLLRQIIGEMEQLYAGAHDSEKYSLSGSIGNLYRIYGNQDAEQLIKAEKYLNVSLEIAKIESESLKEMITLIRIGEVYKYKFQHQKALQLFYEALTICKYRKHETYLDFVYQHLGKCYLEMQDYKSAQHYFQRAYTLRQQKGDGTLLNSTLKAQVLCKQLMMIE